MKQKTPKKTIREADELMQEFEEEIAKVRKQLLDIMKKYDKRRSALARSKVIKKMDSFTV